MTGATTRKSRITGTKICIRLRAVHTDPSIDQLSCDLIRERLRPGRCRGAPNAELLGQPETQIHRAAVLLPLYRLNDGWHLIFIRRAEHEQDRHSGEVSLPGGRWQPTDPNCTATALREAQEEIGLCPSQVTLLGELRPLRTVSQYLVTPVVSCIPWPQSLRPDPREVSHIFSMPLAWLHHPANHRIRTYPDPDHPQARQVVFFDDFEGERLWGVTARITLDFLDCLSRPL